MLTSQNQKWSDHFLIWSIFAMSLMLTSCGSGDAAGEKVGCTIPCLAEAPMIDVSSVSSATGGAINVTVKIQGDITNINNITILLNTTKIDSGFPAGSGSVFNPPQATNTIAVTVEAGTAQGNYYPNISFTVESPPNSGNQYYIDPTKSESHYTYTEVVSGIASTPILTGFQVPVMVVTP